MRLQCPNCDAEYEVDEAAIPLAGRDVQCSSCGHAWFQQHPESLPPEEETALFGSSVDGALPPPEPDPEPEPDLPAEDILDAPEPAPELPRRTIDETVLAVLREEAEREAAARRGERPVIETQTELPLPEAPRPTPRPAPPAPPPMEPPSKRALLPEIEEIKSSLNPSVVAEDAAPEAPQAVRGFGSGFIFVLLIAVVFLAVYVLADLITQQVPALKPVLTAYVHAVDAARIWLDAKVQALISWLQTKAAGTNG